MRMLHPVPMDYVGLIPIALASLNMQKCKIYNRNKQFWFQNINKSVEYGPFKIRKEASDYRKLYLRYIKYLNSK